MAAILSIQSQVVYGHVGLSASTYPLQRMGHEVWGVPTVLLSNHAGYPGTEGRRLPGQEVAALLRGLDARGALDRADAVLTGYLGGGETGEAAGAAVRDVRRRRPGATVLVDPVMGDAGKGLYLPKSVGLLYRDVLLKHADVATPNQFELGWLTGTEPATPAEVAAAAWSLPCPLVFVTSVTAGLAEDEIGLMAVAPDGAWMVRTPRLPYAPNGAGDLAAALILAELLAGEKPAQAAARAASALHAVIAAAAAEGLEELPVTRDALWLRPPRLFPARRL